MVDASFATTANVPLHELLIPESPPQHTTLFAYPAVDCDGSSLWALVELDMRSKIVLGLVQAAAVEIEHDKAARAV